MTPQETQIGGTHYKDLAIQPVEYITKNNIGYCEGNVIKYVTRHQSKGGRVDLLKAKHYIDLILELKYGKEVDAEDAAVAESRINEPMLDFDEVMEQSKMAQGYEMYERLNELHCRFLERLMRLYTSILKDEIAKHQKDRVEIITNTPKPRTSTENRESLEPMFKYPWDLAVWHNPENVTQEQLGEGYRFLVPWEVDGRYRRGICDIWFGRSEWDKKANGDNLDYTYRVPASTPIPPKP